MGLERQLKRCWVVSSCCVQRGQEGEGVFFRIDSVLVRILVWNSSWIGVGRGWSVGDGEVWILKEKYQEGESLGQGLDQGTGWSRIHRSVGGFEGCICRKEDEQCHQEGGRAAQNCEKRIEGCVFEDKRQGVVWLWDGKGVP